MWEIYGRMANEVPTINYTYGLFFFSDISFLRGERGQTLGMAFRATYLPQLSMRKAITAQIAYYKRAEKGQTILTAKACFLCLRDPIIFTR